MQKIQILKSNIIFYDKINKIKLYLYSLCIMVTLYGSLKMLN